MTNPVSADVSKTSIRAARTTPGEWFILAAILLVSCIVRLPFWPLKRDLGDSLYYSIGALKTHVAHPPGSIGYCLLIGWLNDVVHNVNFTMLLTGFVAALVAIVVCHRVAKAMGMSATAALLGTCLFAFSVNTLKAGLQGGPHILEGVCSLLFALFAWRAIQHQRLADALTASLVLALAGSFRPTTTLLLFPLWMLMIGCTLHTFSDIRKILLNLLVLIPIVALWSWGNNHYMTLNGYGGQTYQTQILTTTTYDYDSLSSNPGGSDGTARLSFHMPGAEILAWVEVKTGLRLMPHVPGWPTPSLGRALRLIVMQTLKQGWWLTLSLPAIVFVPIAIFLNGTNRSRPGFLRSAFFAVWVLPSIAFFILGHMGYLTYLQVYMGGLCLWTTSLILNDPDHAAAITTYRSLRLAALVGSVVISIAFFTATVPFKAQGGVRRALDLIMLQYDGASVRQGFTASRRLGPADVDAPPSPFEQAKTDDELLQAARANHYPYMRDSSANSR